MRPGCDPGCACAANEFTERHARDDLAKLRRSGPVKTTRWLLDGLSVGGVAGWSVLDIGAGVGAVHLELLDAGAASAVDVDVSSAFVAAARDEAARRGRSDAVTYEIGDFVALAPSVEPADIVALDRVVCCYADMAALVSLSAARARRRYGLVYPRDTWWIRSGRPGRERLRRAVPIEDAHPRPRDPRGRGPGPGRGPRGAHAPHDDVLAGGGVRAADRLIVSAAGSR